MCVCEKEREGERERGREGERRERDDVLHVIRAMSKAVARRRPNSSPPIYHSSFELLHSGFNQSATSMVLQDC